MVSESEEDQLMGQGLLDGDDEVCFVFKYFWFDLMGEFIFEKVGQEISEEILLQDDEEEEDENEDRSWRR